MQSNTRGSKMLLLAFNKQQENTSEYEVRNITADSEGTPDTNLPSTEDASVKDAVTTQSVTSNGDRSSVRSRSTSSSASSSSSSFSEDNDDSLCDTTYAPDNVSSDSDSENNLNRGNCATRTGDDQIPSTSFYPSVRSAEAIIPNSLSNTSMILTSPLRKGVKRKRNQNTWKRNLNKKFRNSGKQYEIHATGNKVRKERTMKPPCTQKCKVNCSTKFTEEERKQIFTSFWDLGNLEKQRQFIANNMDPIQPKYQYVRVGGTRKKRDNNNAFYLYRNAEKVRVCKLFFKNTLDLNDRPIRTVLEKRNKVANVLVEEDRRGKHGKQKKVDPVLKEGVKNFVDKIPKIESHYTRANTSKHFIDGSKSIADIHRDYMDECKEKNIPFVNYIMFYRIFTEDFNTSFFLPKKDLCETCTAYDNAEGEEKEKLKEYYDLHNVEKQLARNEKKFDKEESNALVAVYDLQAVMQLPKGNVSVFYYKSKLNVLNFTIYDLKTNECECYVWDESNGHRGINELGTCVLHYFNKKAALGDQDLIFYSDNCPGQQKNKFMIALYLYAVCHLNIKSITHKYLIKGHTENEGDSAHSLIERQVKRQLKGGPMYTPESFITAIRAAKKTGPKFNVTELCFEDFFDIKTLASEIGPLNMSQVKLATVKVLRVERASPTSLFIKTSYMEDDFKMVTIIKKKKKNDNITLTRAFHAKPGIADNKKQDLLELVQKNIIPKFYCSFYQNL